MVGEVPLSPSQVRKDGRWRPVRHNTAPSLRSSRPTSAPRRRSSLRAVLRCKPLSTISEDIAPSTKSNSTVSLKLNAAVPYQPSAWSHSTEHLLYFHPSQQLQNYQSVSFHCTGEACESMPRLYRTQSQWVAPSTRSDELGDTPAYRDPNTSEEDTYIDRNLEEGSESGIASVVSEEDIPREAIADLFHRVEEYEREHPEIVRDSGKVWVRANSVGHGLIRTMSTLHKKPTFEARLGHNVPVQSQLRIYEKPSHTERVKIAVHDCWRKFRNWSTGRDTELWAKKSVVQQSYPVMNASSVSLDLPRTSPTRCQFGPRKLSRAPRVEERTDGAGIARRDSKLSAREQLRRRKSSLFLDTIGPCPWGSANLQSPRIKSPVILQNSPHSRSFVVLRSWSGSDLGPQACIKPMTYLQLHIHQPPTLAIDQILNYTQSTRTVNTQQINTRDEATTIGVNPDLGLFFPTPRVEDLAPPAYRKKHLRTGRSPHSPVSCIHPLQPRIIKPIVSPAAKMSPKRALFSLNVDSETDHIYHRVNDHSKPGEKTKVIETSGPTVGHTDLQFVSKPFEKLVNRTVEGVEEATGKKVHSAEGELTYSSQRSSTGTGRKTVKDSTRTKRRIEKLYDTSDL
ncbi:hypothetical protein OPT61_g5155 [Boeremia exigua]|uniref:Uncharacterized protein n=1 Tax=Boeremia exigua TaxID=749465 RepID=A0ACC2IBB6_9PLEO|nr:hypothetical protein OPT61_g5155 [Boeremia exigua]